jgi:hypothetical protein
VKRIAMPRIMATNADENFKFIMRQNFQIER